MGTVHARELPPPGDPMTGQAGQPGGPSSSVQLNSISAQVVRVHVEGVARTKDQLVVQNIKPVFKAKHFEDMVLRAQNVRNTLQDLGCFSNVDIHIDTCTDGGPRDYEVTFKVTELRRVTGNINTMVGNQEGSLLTGIKMPNLAGRGEKLQFEYTYGTRKTNTFNVSLTKPLHNRHRAVVTSSIYQQMAEFPSSGYKDITRGMLLDASFISAPQISHSLQWEGCWRDLRALNRSTAFVVREQAGHTVKSAVRHILSVDRRDDKVFPNEGSFFRLTQEFAGFGGGDIGFFKNDLELQANVPTMWQDVVLQGTFNCGLINQISDGSKTMTIADKFFLGGPLNVRGFEMRGLGRLVDGNAVGGNAFWACGLHLFAPLPFRPGRGGFGDLFRTHVFVNAGNLGDFALGGNAERNVEELLRKFRLSYGVGVALRLGGVARIELNYCIPVRAERGDKPAPGLQFGVGVNFL